MIIDFHTHIFPDKLASKTIRLLAQRAGIPFFADGSAEGTLKVCTDAGVDICVVQNIATNEKQMTNVNNFAISCIDNERLIPFGSVHPESHNWEDELKRLKEAGIKGIKLHPDYQDFYIDEPRMQKIYEQILKLDFILLFHAGLDAGLPDPIHATPDRIKNIFSLINGERVVLAHMGGFNCWDRFSELFLGEDIYIDTSMATGYLDDDKFKNMLINHDKILFACDLPWSNPKEVIKKIKGFGFSDEKNDGIFYKNALKLLR